MEKKTILMLALSLVLIFLGAPANAGLIFYDDFNDGNAAGWTWKLITGQAYPWSVEWNIVMDGTYVYSGRGGYEWGGGGSIAYNGDSSLADYSLEAKVKIFDIYNFGSHHGLAGRVQNEGDFYEFSIHGSGGASLIRLQNGGFYPLASASPEYLAGLGIEIVQGNWYLMKMVFKGENVQCFINGIFIYEATDSLYENGKFGLVNAGAETYFDDVAVTVPPTQVSIDIKPGSSPNSINCKNENGLVPVAILSTHDFDATMVDHTTVRFGKTGMEAGEFHIDKHTGQAKRHEEDVDGDGLRDLVFHFRFGDTGLGCGDVEASLTGETDDGESIVGSDSIRMIKQK